ncbi:hypothetical protein AWZ03_014319 [Drosophila navojoa]|uniref:PDZ domain-containing protein n=1 Tax=Drosophila navojoa TaxID=7232 RepID=A0A484ATR3_DRONA|nr:hypothetical protein AWZ03_014319 [Drosophila navojoa]
MCSNNCVNVIELDYVVLKLNGNDITSLSSYDAVQMFLQAKETLVVELCRKRNPVNTEDLLDDDIYADADADADADACDDVFISDIQPESVAERDGRLRRGDQILRINGIDIKSKKHAETQIAENTSSVTLLVSRLLYPDDDDDDDEDDEEIDSNFDYANSILSDDYTNVVDKLDKLLLTQQRQTSANNLITESAAKPIKSATFSGSQMMSSRIVCSQHSSETVVLNNTSADELHPFASATAKMDGKTMRPKSNDEQQSPCPQFNAPNLSRYHFVSSQEVANKTVTTTKTSSILGENVSEEIPMVWKVKRRPDGTRYIVKRPVRNTVSMGIRKNIRNNEITTTEDDTISEVKIGRYWTKEEKKRHIERARERRHHQQLLHQQQHQQFPTQ